MRDTLATPVKTTASTQHVPPSLLVVLARAGASAEDLVALLRKAGLPLEDGNSVEQLHAWEGAHAEHPVTLISREASAPLKDVAEWLNQVPASHVVVVHERPETAVARVLAQAAHRPDEALSEWASAAHELLEFYRYNRRRVTLIERGAVARAPQQCLELLGQRLGVQIPVPTATDIAAPQDVDPVLQAIAIAATRQSDNIERYRAELEASSLPVTEASAATGFDAAAALQEYTAAAPESLAADKQQNATRIEEVEEENELLLTQLHQVQEELESYYLEARDLQRKLTRVEHTLTEKKRQLEYIRNSKSWKLTAPLRGLLELANAKRRKPAQQT